MNFRKLIPLLMFVLPLRLCASGPVVPARVATIIIDPGAITPLHLQPEFESAIHMPEEVISVILGSPGAFKAEHNEGEPEYVYVKPITKAPAQSNLLIALKSGQHVTLELITDGASNTRTPQPVDFLIEYRTPRGLLVASSPPPDRLDGAVNPNPIVPPSAKAGAHISSQQARINTPGWMKWEGRPIQTAVGDIRQWRNQTVVAYSLFNSSDHAVEIVPPQIQISGGKLKKKHKEGKEITSEQLEVREYRLSSTRLEAGARADGVVVFDHSNFKQSTEKLFLTISYRTARPNKAEASAMASAFVSLEPPPWPLAVTLPI